MQQTKMDNTYKMPFYAKVALAFISLFAFAFILHIGQHIIIPILYAIIVAILLNPLVNYLVSKKINRILSISLAVLLAVIVVTVVLYVISSQVSMFRETYPQLKEKVTKSSSELVHWISEKFNIRTAKIDAWMSDARIEAIDNFAIGERLSEAGRILVNAMLLPAYVFMILYYKSLLLEFVRKLFHLEHHIAVAEVLVNIKNIIESYLVGLFFEMLIVAILNSVGLLLIGVDYAIILGVTGAILNIVPYIGGILAIALPMIIAYVTKDSLTYPALVFVVYTIIQFADNHYIVPKIVASRVQLNALISVIVVLIGGAVWGVPGMFVSIPLTAIFKVIFDHIGPLKPVGFLLGNTVPTRTKFFFIHLKKVK